MNSARNIRKSAMNRARSLLAAPPAGAGFASGYTLYDVADLRAVARGDLLPVRPSVFVVEGRLKPVDPAFPLIMVSAMVDYHTFELGNVSGGQALLDFNVVGRMSGERDDLAHFLAKQFGRTLPLYNYSSGSAGAFIENALIGDVVKTFDDEIDRDALRAEGSYDYWEVVRFMVDFLQS